MSSAGLRLAAPLAVAAVALSSAGCSRDLDVPSSAPPRVDAVALVGLEPQAVASSLPVLGGELVAIHGAGFPSSAADVEVRIGSEFADVLEVRQDRLVARVPVLGTFGAVDLQVQTAQGPRSLPGAFRYEGAGQPSGFASSDLDTQVRLGFVAPIHFPLETSWFSPLAVAAGASDSALIVAAEAGYAVGMVPLGIIPSAVASWIDVDFAGSVTVRVNVLAVSRGSDGAALEGALGTVSLDSGATSFQGRASARRLTWSLGTPGPCAWPLVTATSAGQPVVTWAEGPLADRHRLAAVSVAAARGGVLAAVDPGAVHTLAAPVVGWGPWGATSIVLAAGTELYAYDVATPRAPPVVLRVAPGGGGAAVPVTALVAPGPSGSGCPAAIDRIHALATASDQGAEALALSYRAGGSDRVALVELAPGPAAGTVHSGLTGIPRVAVALAPDPAYGAPVRWQALGAGGTDVLRLRPAAGARACADLVPDAAVQLSRGDAFAGVGGLATVVDGTRVLVITGDGDLVTILPPSLTSAGPILRIASYGGVSVRQVDLGGTPSPVVIAEHAPSDSAVSDIDTGSALLAVSLAGDRSSVALGGAGYGRGAVWLEGASGGALAYTGDLRGTGADAFARGGAAAVTPIGAGSCPGETVRIAGWRRVTGGPDLITQGPAWAGAFGPSGVARFGPAAPPIYAVRGTSLYVYAPEPARLDCLIGGAGRAPTWDPAATGVCAPDARVELGFSPLDVTLSAGDRVAAMRTLDRCDTVCREGDEVCLRATCPAARRLVLVRPDPAAATSIVVPLPAPPVAVAADRGGGFLVTMACLEGTAAGGRCFGADPLCRAHPTAPGDVNGAVVLAREDGGGVDCLAVGPGLAGPLAVTPNGAEVWVAGATPSAEHLVRLGLQRRPGDGALDVSRAAVLVSTERLHTGLSAPPGGVAFTPDGGTGVVTVPGQFRILLRE